MSDLVERSGEPRRTQPLGLVVAALQGMRSLAISLVAIFFVMRDDLSGFSWGVIAFAGIALVVIAVTLFISWLDWSRRTFTVGADDIRVESGIISRQARSVPYDRIQDVSLEQKLLPRLFGLVSVKFETGAGGKDELSLSYLTADEGEELRSTVRALKAGAASGAVAAAGEEAASQEEDDGRTLFAMGPKRLLTFGVFEFSLAFVAVLFGITQQFEFLFPFDPWDPDVWMGWVNAGNERLEALGPMARFAGFAAAAVSLVLTGLVAGIGKTFLRDWDFRLDDTPRGLRRRRGLLTKTDVMMPLHRVQALTLGTGFIRRLFGWHGLKVVSLAQDSGNASHDVVPFGQMEEIAPVADVTGFRLPDAGTDWQLVHPKYRIYRAAIGIGACIIGVIGFLWAKAVLPPDAWGMGLGAAIMAGFAVFFAMQQYALWRFERHAIDARQVYTRRGIFSPRVQVGNRVKLQSAEVKQGLLGRIGGYATLDLGLAGGTLRMPGLPLGVAHEMREAAVESMCSTDFAATRQAS